MLMIVRRKKVEGIQTLGVVQVLLSEVNSPYNSILYEVDIRTLMGCLWLTVVFLVFDVCFSISCVALACVIGIALRCCLPCIIEFLYAEEGASEADLSMLPRYRFQISDSEEKPSTGEGKMVLLMNVGELADECVLSRCAMLKFMACHAIISFMKYAS
ncbi:hypothetical protein MKW98_008811 [Papaver atlanticum]|uniref:Uncharacterized protein n=1 Tax=Papaver atlanticum TaxID=357466 RepID=A0AAD4S6Q1_9MAGN|nr:hypothetical protein MKW98_008811 [Papaver atlanticum]